jgi:hypothetical protein
VPGERRLGRRQSQRLLGKLGRHRRRAALGRDFRGVVEQLSNLGIGHVASKG